MIKSTELMLGNYIISTAYGQETIVKVTGIRYNFAYFEDQKLVDLKLCKGIPLTQSILQDAGYKFSHLAINEKRFEYRGLFKLSLSNESAGIYDIDNNPIEEIFYLHELQNFHEVFKEPLTINL